MPWFWRTDEQLPELVEAIRAVGKPATGISAVPISVDNPQPQRTATRFGGDPYAEAGDRWPTFGESRRPLDFLCQIDLRECSHLPALETGLIVVFFCWRSEEEGTWMDPGACVTRRYADPTSGKAVRLSRPASADESDYRVTACAARRTTMISYPSCEAEAARESPVVRDLVMRIGKFDRLDPSGHESERERVYRRALKRVDVPDQETTRVGGYPAWIQTYGGEFDWPFVLQIGHETAANICVGDGGVLLVHRDDSGVLVSSVDTH